MSKLRDEHWKETSFHEVVRAHLFAEGAKKLRKKDFDALVRFAGYTPEECWKRIRLLYADARRRFLYGEVPPDTRWYVVDRLKDRHLKELDVIAHCEIEGDGSRRVTEVAKRVNWTLQDKHPSSLANTRRWSG